MESELDFVWRSLRRLGLSDADADDCAQEVFLIAHRKLGMITAGSERRFLFATAVRVASTRRRTIRRRREEPSELFIEGSEGGVDTEPSPEQQLQLGQARERLQRILDGMDLELRAVFILYELEQMTVPEIAATLSVPVGTVSSRLRSARATFAASVRRLALQATSNGGLR